LTTFVLGAKPEKGFKLVKMSLAKQLRKEFQKKRERGQALLGRPASLSAHSAAQPSSPSPSPARGCARLAPPGAGHVAAVRRRRGRSRPTDRHNPVGTPPRAPRPPPLCPLPTPSYSPPARSSNRGGALPCAIDGAAKLTTPTTRIRLNPPLAPPRRALPRALTLGRPRQGIGLDPVTAPWPELRRALGPRESLPSRPSFSSVVSAFWSPHHREPYSPLRSCSIGRRRPDAGEPRHRAPPCAIPTATDLLRRCELVQRVRLAETKP